MYKRSLFFMCLLWGCYNFTAHATNHKASLQRGAKLFMNYCSGCHSLKYMHYNQMAQGLGLVTFDGRVDDDLLKNNLIFTQALVNAPIEIALSPEDAKQWFGVVPPDLSLVVRERGARWLHLYLSSFYNDKSRPFGVNNRLVHDVMIHQRFKIFKNAKNKYLVGLRKGHKVHHKHLGKEEGECFGMLFVPFKYFKI